MFLLRPEYKDLKFENGEITNFLKISRTKATRVSPMDSSVRKKNICSAIRLIHYVLWLLSLSRSYSIRIKTFDIFKFGHTYTDRTILKRGNPHV